MLYEKLGKHKKLCMCVWVVLVTEYFAILGEMVTRRGEDRMKKGGGWNKQLRNSDTCYYQSKQ